MKTPEEINSILNEYYGTENYYKLPFSRLVCTDGVVRLAEECQCNWFINEINIAITELNRKRCSDFYSITLSKSKRKNNSSAKITITDGNGYTFKTKNIQFTDFPLDEYEVWCIDNVIMLKSEY